MSSHSWQPMPWQPQQPRQPQQPQQGIQRDSWRPAPWPPQRGPQPSMLAANADRERAVDVLRAGFTEGRLQQEEYENRIERAYGARTVGELSVLVADLPQGPVPPETSQTTPSVPRTFLPAARSDANVKSIGALSFGVAGFATAGVTSIPAIVLGHMARNEIRRTGEKGDGMALGGLVLGWIGVVLFVVVIIAAAV